ncbi:MAG TPA: hypothetical protein VG274_02605, partial [Rhizomicrobium sp.]|nr:hypothetical protein [Rhizomicrobium sp.]
MTTKAAPAPTKVVAKSAGVSKTAVKSTAAAKAGTTAAASSKGIAKKAVAKRAATPRYTAQQQPTSDRYRDIQQALADRGYF